jgi:Amt family ammonium transporter
MKKMIALLALFGACSFAAPVIAQDKPAAPAAEAKPAEAKPAEAKPAEAKPAEAAPAAAAAAAAPAAAAAAAPAPVPNKGDTAWMIVATVLVILMTIPGLALFYGGLVRTKNML